MYDMYNDAKSASIFILISANHRLNVINAIFVINVNCGHTWPMDFTDSKQYECVVLAVSFHCVNHLYAKPNYNK